MKLQRYNKATAAVLGGAITSILSAFVVMDPTLADAVQTVVVALLVLVIPNKE